MSTHPEQLTIRDWPPLLAEMADPPKQLYIRGTMPLVHPETKFLCIVGSRKHTSYGADMTKHVVATLAGYPVIIVSGLAYGIDSIAHRAALAAHLPTISFPGSGLDPTVLYPQAHVQLAEEICTSGGCLLAEFDPLFHATKWSFPQRNRLMAGACHAVLIIEGGEKSGTIITAKLALDYNRDVCVLPGLITAPTSVGSNRLMQEGAHPLIHPTDIIDFLGFTHTVQAAQKHRAYTEQITNLSPQEKRVFTMLIEPLVRDTIAHRTGLPIAAVSIALAQLELRGLIREQFGQVVRVV